MLRDADVSKVAGRRIVTSLLALIVLRSAPTHAQRAASADSARDSTSVGPGMIRAKRRLGTAVGSEPAAVMHRRRPAASLLDLIGSGLAGVDLARAGGTVGVGGRLRIRGTTSLLLSSDPLIVVDGMRVEGATSSASVAFGGSGARPARVDDFDPAEIESIEVLNGPAAAGLYGGDAASGVILITTRRPKPGRAAFDLQANAGASWLADPEGRFPTNYYVSRAGSIQGFDVLRFNEARGFPDVFSTGIPVQLRASVTGGSDRLRYYLNADGARDRDYLSYSWRNRYGGRANLTFTSADRRFEIDFDAGIRRAHTRSASGIQPITTSIVWACNFPGCEPNAGPDSATTGWNGPGHGYQFYRPEDYDRITGSDGVTRTTATISIVSRPTSWFQQRLFAGPDLTRDAASLVVAATPNGNPLLGPGLSTVNQVDATRLSAGYVADLSWRLGRSIAPRTTIGAEWYSRKLESSSGAGVSGSLPSATSTFQSTVVGAYARQEIAWRNRLFVDGGLRVSDDRLAGEGLGRRTDVTVGASVLAVDRSSDPATNWLSRLRVRGGWGRVGRWPGEALSFSLAPASAPKLVPERSSELETGLDVELWSGRVTVSGTWYHRDISDAVIPQLTPPSQGLIAVLGNGAALTSSGVELTVSATPIRSTGATLELGATFATNRSTVRTLTGGPSFIGSAFIQQWNVIGFAPGSFFYRNVVSAAVGSSSIAGVPIPVAVNPQCESGTNLGLGNGMVVPCTNAPQLYAGQPTPTWLGSASATLSIRDRFRLFGLVDYRGGNSVVVGDVAAMHGFFLSSKATLDGTDPILLADRDFNQPNLVGRTGLFKAGFARLRTMSAEYRLPGVVARWVGAGSAYFTVAVDNLAILWREQKESFGVGWIDPELIPNGGIDPAGLQAYTQDPLPLARRVTISLRFAF